MKLALLLPGYLDSPDYLHMMIFAKGLEQLGYTVERLDPCNLWATGNAENYSVTNFLAQIKERVNFYKSGNPDEVLLVGHSSGAFTAIIAGSQIDNVTKIVALCSPADKYGSESKWKQKGPRISQRDLPGSSTQFREFSIPYSYIEDALQYSAVDEVKKIHKPLMIFIALNDDVVLPNETEKIVAHANNPYVVRQKGMGHDFRQSEEECIIVMSEIEKFLKQT